MKPIDRRSFLKNAGAAAAGTLLARPEICFAAESRADMVLRNGVIVTMNDAQPLAEAMAVRDGRVMAVGSLAEITPLTSPATKVMDLAGNTVTPGIIDAHSHLIGFGHMQLDYVIVRPPQVHSFETLRTALAAAARNRPAGEWIVARGFDTFDEGRFPRRQELDTAVPNHPVLVIHWGGQFGIANTLGLKKANLLRADAKDPYGGKFLRDRRTGIPDGVLIHYPAIYSVFKPEPTDQDQFKYAAWATSQFASRGVTCVHDNFIFPKMAKNYVRLERAGKLPCRVRVYPYVANLEMCQKLVQAMRRYEGPLVRMQGVKLAVDGYAWMYDIPQQHRHMAIPMHPQPQFNAIVAAIHNAGLQADVHAVGDKGVDWTLEAFLKAAGSAAQCRARRHRIEHYPFRKLDSIGRTAQFGVPVCVQPAYIQMKAEDFREKFGAQNRGYVETMVPLKTFAKEGVKVAFGADVPAFPSFSPLDSIRCAMDRETAKGARLDASEAVTLYEALRHHTIESAYAALDEKEIGSLEKGKAADFVIWNKDLRTIRTGRDVMGLAAEATYVNGRAVYEA